MLTILRTIPMPHGMRCIRRSHGLHATTKREHRSRKNCLNAGFKRKTSSLRLGWQTLRSTPKQINGTTVQRCRQVQKKPQLCCEACRMSTLSAMATTAVCVKQKINIRKIRMDCENTRWWSALCSIGSLPNRALYADARSSNTLLMLPSYMRVCASFDLFRYTELKFCGTALQYRFSHLSGYGVTLMTHIHFGFWVNSRTLVGCTKPPSRGSAHTPSASSWFGS